MLASYLSKLAGFGKFHKHKCITILSIEGDSLYESFIYFYSNNTTNGYCILWLYGWI